MQKLGIHHMSALELDPPALVSLAADTQCQEVSVFTQTPGSSSRFPLVTRENLPAMKARLQQTGVVVANVDAFILTPDTQVEDFRPALELGAELGARGAVAIAYDPEESRIVDTLAALCDIAEPLGLRIALEFVAFTPSWNTLPAAARLIDTIAHPNLGIDLDILHLVRSGGTAADIAGIDPGLIVHAQLCDGADLGATADYGEEAAGNRLAPGDGVFPLAEFLTALPPDTALELEMPQPQGRPPSQRVGDAVAAIRKLCSSL